MSRCNIEYSDWVIELHSDTNTIRIYRMEGSLADEDIDVPASILPELYQWLINRMVLEPKGWG